MQRMITIGILLMTTIYNRGLIPNYDSITSVFSIVISVFLMYFIVSLFFL